MQTELPRDADRQTIAALVLLAAARPRAVSDLLLETAAADRVSGATERATLLERVARWLAPHRFSLWRSARLAFAAFGGAWREATLETDLELEAEELEEKARRPDGTGTRRGRVSLAAVVILGVLALSAFGLIAAGPEDVPTVRIVALLAALVVVTVLGLDWLLARLRLERARLELVSSPRVVIVWRDRDGTERELVSFGDLETDERVRVVLEEENEDTDGGKVWDELAAYRVRPDGTLEREEA